MSAFPSRAELIETFTRDGEHEHAARYAAMTDGEFAAHGAATRRLLSDRGWIEAMCEELGVMGQMERNIVELTGRPVPEDIYDEDDA